MKRLLKLLLVFAVFAVGFTFINTNDASAASAPGLTKIQIEGISKNDNTWETLSGDIARAKTTFNLSEDNYVYFKVRYTGYSNANILYNGSQSFSNSVAVNYNTTYITSNNIVTGFVRYYRIPLSAFNNNSYTLKILGFSTNASQQVWSNTVSFPVQ